ncbi:MAG: hypothetical protein M3Y12_02405 [Bacteroidota bacterium]|nr:hypothetical protein [Bacteroidota bacterium]
MKANSLSNKYFSKFLRLLQEGFAGELTFANDEEASVCALNAHQKWLDELDDNLLNMHSTEQTLYLEGQFLKLERFGDLMPSDNDEITQSLTKNGLDVLLEALGGEGPVELLADKLEPGLVEEVRVYRIRNRFLHDNPNDSFAALTGLDLQTYQLVFASQLLSLAWHTLTSRYTLRGGIEKAVPRKRRWKVKIETSIRNDLRSFMPEMREMTAQSHPTEEDVYNEWGRHLTSLSWWNYPYAGSWLAPVEYEQAFHDAPDRGGFVAGFRRLIGAIKPILNLPDEDNPLFGDDNANMSQKSRDKMRQEHLHQARVNAMRMLQWLHARQKSAAAQLLEALEYIVLVPVWSDETWGPTNVLTIADYCPEREMTLRFELLLSRLQDNMPTTQPELNLLHDRLTRLVSYPNTAPLQADFESGHSSPNLADLVLLLPPFTLKDRTPDVTTLKMAKVADDFCARLLTIINHRLPWAERALNLVEIALARPTNVKNKPALSLKQIALLHIYRGEVINRGEEASGIARQHGHNSGEKLRKHYNYYNQPKNRTGVTRDKAKAVIADIKAVIPHLDTLYQQRANNELEAIRA